MRRKAFYGPSVRNLEKTIHEFWLFEEMRLFSVYANKGRFIQKTNQNSLLFIKEIVINMCWIGLGNRLGYCCCSLSNGILELRCFQVSSWCSNVFFYDNDNKKKCAIPENFKPRSQPDMVLNFSFFLCKKKKKKRIKIMCQHAVVIQWASV